MGRPINKKFFGVEATPTQAKILANGVVWSNGDVSTDVAILRQVGSKRYIVTDGTHTEVVTLVPANSAELLAKGQCAITARSTSSEESFMCVKISQYRATVMDDQGKIRNVTWSLPDSKRLGQVELNSTQYRAPE